MRALRQHGASRGDSQAFFLKTALNLCKEFVAASREHVTVKLG